MADSDVKQDKIQPTEEQVKAHNDVEEAKWQGDYKDEDLIIPYKQKVEADKPDKKAENEETEKKAEERAKGEVAEEEVQHDEPISAITIEDPGEYQPDDYSFEATIKDGKKVTIKTPEEAEKLAEDPENFETPKQLMDFMNKQNKMIRQLDKDYEKWEQQHETFTKQLETETQRREQVETFVGEMNYLVGKGLLPKVAKEYVDADWSDPEIAAQPGVKEQISLLTYMNKENEVRAKAGVKPLASLVDAYNAWQMDETTKKERDEAIAATEAEKKAAQARKAAGGRVAGVSPAQQGTYIPKGIAVGNPHVFDRGNAQWED